MRWSVGSGKLWWWRIDDVVPRRPAAIRWSWRLPWSKSGRQLLQGNRFEGDEREGHAGSSSRPRWLRLPRRCAPVMFRVATKTSGREVEGDRGEVERNGEAP